MSQSVEATRYSQLSESGLSDASRYSSSSLRVSSPMTSVSDKFSLGVHPELWGTTALLPNDKEDDDYLHIPDRDIDSNGHIFTGRGMANLGCLLFLGLGILMLFAGFPIISFLRTPKQDTHGGFNLGGINATGQTPSIGNFGLIDLDTPQSAYTKKSYVHADDEWQLVFSDEFETEGRSFYPGDDPYWEAVDFHYWGTRDLEWQAYDPSQVTTKGGALRLTLAKADPAKNHNLEYKSGMIQSWNKFCFTGGILEAAVTLPGTTNVGGLWPAVWAMGNLGRAGYGASLDGTWPYSYDSCDVGTLPNQTYPGTKTPAAALVDGDSNNAKGALSFLAGQRLSRCTCPGESHPGPIHANGDFVGRSAPEIDIFEALTGNDVDGTVVGQASMSAQWAPMGAAYKWQNTSANAQYYNDAFFNRFFSGNAWQQCTSGLTKNNQDCYELQKGCFAVYAFEYQPGFDDGYIAWINDDKLAWVMRGPAMAGDPDTEVGTRVISQEPMYIIANLGLSSGFATIDFDNLKFPTTMSIDYIRVYQPKDKVNIGCDPEDFPTADYITAYKEAYTNPNLTTWEQYGQPQPKNRLAAGGCS